MICGFNNSISSSTQSTFISLIYVYLFFKLKILFLNTKIILSFFKTIFKIKKDKF
jgi:hypothetical protein